MQILHRGIFMPAFDRILQLARMEEMGCEFVEVTAHEGTRPTHAVWQGRVYHRGGAVVQDGERYEDFEAATGYGTGPGLCGWNCRHNFYPFYPGISVRNYTDERLAELDARNIPYGGGLFAGHSNTGQTTGIESDSTEDDERTASAFRIGHRAGTAVLPPCSTPQQLTEHQNKSTRRGTAGAFVLVELTGVEPVSEKKAVRVSPGAVHLLRFPQCERVHTLDTLVAS